MIWNYPIDWSSTKYATLFGYYILQFKALIYFCTLIRQWSVWCINNVYMTWFLLIFMRNYLFYSNLSNYEIDLVLKSENAMEIMCQLLVGCCKRIILEMIFEWNKRLKYL